MLNLEKKSVEIQNGMHDSVTHNFDRVSDLNDNGSTPLQGQQDEQPEGVYWLVSIFRDSSMFTADSTPSIDSCLAEDRLYSEDSLICSAASDIDTILVGLVVKIIDF